MFADWVGTYLSFQDTPGLAHKRYIEQVKLASEKLTSLLQKFVNHGRKKFYNSGPCTIKFLMDIII